VIQTGYLTPFELADPQVEQRMRELEPQAVMGPAMRRARHAQSTALFMEHFFKLSRPPVAMPRHHGRHRIR
jgi:hypothetical protein